MSVIWWVRHGPTNQSVFTGWRDVPADLSDKAKLARLSAYLPRDASIVSSDLQRAVATADAIAGAREQLIPQRSLREFNFGEWDGQSFADVANAYPELSRQYWEAPGDAAPPGGESWNAASARIGRCVDQLREAQADQDIVIVAHYGVILSEIGRATGKLPFDLIAQNIDPLSVTRIDYAARTAGPINHNP
ncbi:MAG: histidine phosphatase family protein [Pseudomonadota bacterium]